MISIIMTTTVNGRLDLFAAKFIVRTMSLKKASEKDIISKMMIKEAWKISGDCILTGFNKCIADKGRIRQTRTSSLIFSWISPGPLITTVCYYCLFFNLNFAFIEHINRDREK